MNDKKQKIIVIYDDNVMGYYTVKNIYGANLSFEQDCKIETSRGYEISRTFDEVKTTLELSDNALQKITLDEKDLKAIADFNLSIEQKILKKENEKLELELQNRETKIKKLGELKELYIKYLQSDFTSFDDWVKFQFENDEYDYYEG